MAQSEPDVILFLVGNKKDKEEEREVTADRVEKFKRDRNILFSFETSAKTGENIENLFIFASKILYHNNKDRIALQVSQTERFRQNGGMADIFIFGVLECRKVGFRRIWFLLGE